MKIDLKNEFSHWLCWIFRSCDCNYMNDNNLFRSVTKGKKPLKAIKWQVSKEEQLDVLGNVSTAPDGYCNEIDKRQ